jgi:translocation and assembly module TamB
MRISTKLAKRLGIGVAVALAGVVVVRTWVVPAVIQSRLQGMVEGRFTFRDWWLNGRSAGLVGVTLHEGRGADSPIFASVGRVTTDLSLLGLLRGRVSPGRMILDEPKVTFRLDRGGRFVNLPAIRPGSGGSPDLPSLEARNAEVTFRPQGRPEMHVRAIAARLDAGDKAILSGETDDPAWGHWEVSGTIDRGFQSGSVALVARRFEADLEKLARVPFVPREVWSHFVPHGPVAIDVVLQWGGKPDVETRAEVTFQETRADFPSLGLSATGTTGRLIVENGVILAEEVHGSSIGGTVSGGGTLNLVEEPARIDLGLDLRKVNVAETPKSWQLDEAGITGLLTGKVRLKAILDPKGVDLSGTSGEAVVEGGTIKGIPVKSLRLVMHAEKDDLQFETRQPTDSAALSLPVSGGDVKRTGPVATPLGWVGAFPAPYVIALQAPAPEPKKDEPASSGIRLPRSITTQIELDDVEMAKLIARVEFLLGFPFPIPIQGRLGLKATATIPLGKLENLRDYAFHGDLTLKGASIDKVDFGRLSARIDLADGVLELKNVRGRLVNRPDGGPDNPPEALPDEVPDQGPIPSGGFRGTLRAELSPPGRLTARFEGNEVPLGELAAPYFPRPTPLAGLTSMNIQAESDLGAAKNPEAWSVSGDARSIQIRYRDAALDGLSVKFALKDGKLDIPALSAQLDGQPLSARFNLDLKPPQAFQGVLDVTDWNLVSTLALVPGAPRPVPAAGIFSARAEARGTLNPRSIQTQGQGRFGRLSAGPVTLGEVPFRWTTEGETIVLSVIEAHAFSGRLSAEARLPVDPGKPTEGTVSIRGLDTALLSAALPREGLKLTGKADGQAEFRIPSDVSALDATVRLSAPDLTIQGFPAERVQGSVHVEKKVLTYEVTAESLGGKVKFKGDVPLTGNVEVNGQFQAVGFELAPAWKALGVSGTATRLEGLGAIDANLRNTLSGDDAGLWVHGIAEFRNLSLGRNYPLGQLRGIVAKTPTSWRVDPLDGDLLGGPARGVAWGTTSPEGARNVEFDFRVDRADLRRALAFVPLLSRNVEGSGTLRLSGGLGATLRASGDINVPRAQLLGLPVRELRAPAELTVEPGSGVGTLRLRRWTTRFAGGQIRGEGSIRLGANQSFQGEVVLTNVDLETVARVHTEAHRPASGRISGRISLNGPDLAQVARYRGRVVLDLDDASIFVLPILSALARFLGSASGGLFEDGDLVGTIANRQLVVETFTLQGRLAQILATGTVGFDGQVNLVVLINTNQIIPQTGQALMLAIPGLRNANGRRGQATLQVANFLSNRLLKLRVTGTIKNPSVSIDPRIVVTNPAVAFFAGVLKLPLGLIK